MQANLSENREFLHSTEEGVIAQKNIDLYTLGRKTVTTQQLQFAPPAVDCHW